MRSLAERSVRKRLGLIALAVVAALVVAACGSSSSTSSSTGGGSTSTPATTGSTTGGSSSDPTAACGTKPGVKATGTPINIGAIATKQPGTDFSDGPNMMAAYFACVNANGGVNGHPLKMYAQYDQTKPSQIASEAKQLIQNDHVVAIAGGFDLLECTVDQKYWKSLGVYSINAGIAPECWSTPNSAPVNMGPRYSSDGAVQYAIDQKVSKIVFVQSNVPGTGYIAGGPAALAKAANVPIQSLTENVPIQNASAVALNLVQDAGSNGWVVLNFTPPEALVILQAAQKLGLEDRVKGWGCSTPCNTDFLAKQLGPKWNHKLFVNAELANVNDQSSPQISLYKAIMAKYGSGVTGGIGSFSQMGFVMAQLTVHALEQVKGAYTLKSVNQAIHSIKNFDTGMECKPWTYGNIPLHIPNNVDYTTTPENGKMVTAQGCQAIPNADPQIAAYRKAAVKAGYDPGGPAPK